MAEKISVAGAGLVGSLLAIYLRKEATTLMFLKAGQTCAGIQYQPVGLLI